MGALELSRVDGLRCLDEPTSDTGPEPELLYGMHGDQGIGRVGARGEGAQLLDDRSVDAPDLAGFVGPGRRRADAPSGTRAPLGGRWRQDDQVHVRHTGEPRAHAEDVGLRRDLGRADVEGGQKLWRGHVEWGRLQPQPGPECKSVADVARSSTTSCDATSPAMAGAVFCAVAGEPAMARPRGYPACIPSAGCWRRSGPCNQAGWHSGRPPLRR